MGPVRQLRGPRRGVRPRVRRAFRIAPVALAIGLALTSRATPPTPTPARTENLARVFPHVWADVERGVVEFEGTVPIDAHDPEAPDVWLEQIACIPDTREHESLVVTDAKPSHVHAALLSCGLDPGEPGSWSVRADRVVLDPPSGPRVRVLIRHAARDGAAVTRKATDWVVSARDGRSLTQHLSDREDAPATAFVFAGSRFVQFRGREVYDADHAGTLIGLATFGGETIALDRVIPHREAVEPLQWKADRRTVPRAGTRVMVRIEIARPAEDPGG